jgi:DNA recombination protein RmuC
LKEDPSLYDYAWKKSIAIVSPTILFAMMKSINSMWQLARQNKNAQEIADKGGKLYDQLLLFFERFEAIGEKIKSSEKAFEEASKTLKTGKGNIVSRTLYLKDLGANIQSNRELPSEFEDYERSENLN